MEKIFDIAKDNAKIWGTIAQGIDNNFEEVYENFEVISSEEKNNLS